MEAPAYFKEIIEVYKTYDTETVNKYLKLGWVMLNVESQQSGAHDWSSQFVLGWFKTSGPVAHPKSNFI
jgi:hypothetical protein